MIASDPTRAISRLTRCARERRQRARQHDQITARCVAADDFDAAASSAVSASLFRRQARLMERECAAIVAELDSRDALRTRETVQ